MSNETKWATEHGNEYTDRNNIDKEERIPIWSSLLNQLGIQFLSVLEVGANRGHNLYAINKITNATVDGVEINDKAINEAFVPLKKGSAYSLPFDDNSFDLVFTAGVLIHLDDYEKAISEMFRISKKYVLAIEYNDKEHVDIKYRNGALCVARPWERIVLSTVLGSMLVDKGKMSDFGIQGKDDFHNTCHWFLFDK